MEGLTALAHNTVYGVRQDFFNRALKICVSGRDPALHGFCKCSHISRYAALSKTPRALADGLILVFQHPV
jgi:hypothetical protein